MVKADFSKDADVTEQIDNILNESPSEIKKVKENLQFMSDVQEGNIPRGEEVVAVFGVETFDLHDIFKDNVWDRSIFTTDSIVNMCIETSIEKMKKYLPKKTKKPFEYWWLILLLIIGVGAVLVIILFLLPMLGGIKLF